MSLESVYHATDKRLAEAKDILAALANNRGNPENNQQRHREISARIDNILSNCDRLDVLVQKEPPGRRQHSKIRVDQLKHDVRHLQSLYQTAQVYSIQCAIYHVS